MKIWKVGLVVLALVLGGLQAWDSQVFNAGISISTLVVLALLIVAATVSLATSPGLLTTAGSVALLLLVVARAMSPSPLPTLFTLAPLIGMALAINWRINEKQQG